MSRDVQTSMSPVMALDLGDRWNVASPKRGGPARKDDKEQSDGQEGAAPAESEARHCDAGGRDGDNGRQLALVCLALSGGQFRLLSAEVVSRTPELRDRVTRRSSSCEASLRGAKLQKKNK